MEPLLRELRWYLQGCERLGWEPVGGDAFVAMYKRYLRCGRAIQKSHRRKATAALIPGGLRFFDRLMTNVIRERDRLDFLSTAVSAGRQMDEGSGGAGVAVMPTRRPPELSGSSSKLRPDLDPEPAWRNP